MKFRTRVLLYSLLLQPIFAILASSQQAAECQQRTIVVNVVDHNGNIIAGLGPSAFRATSRGQRLKVISSIATSAPRRVVILMDLSGSMSKVRDLARLFAGDLATTQQEKLRPALVLFSDHIIDSVDFSRPREEVLRKLANLPNNKGRTALLDALKYAADLFGQPLPGDSVFLISDGGENESKAGQKDIEKEFSAQRVRVFPLYVFDVLRIEPFMTEEERTGPWLLNELAGRTGGVALYLEVDSSKATRERLASEVKRLYQQTTDFYQLQLELPKEPPRKWQRLDLEVLDGQGRKRKHVRLIYPHELAPCMSPVEGISSRQ